MDDKGVTFAVINGEGKTTVVKVVSQKSIMECPKIILLPTHYRDDGSCRCDEYNCEWEGGCYNGKHNGEIYCQMHLETLNYERDV